MKLEDLIKIRIELSKAKFAKPNKMEEKVMENPCGEPGYVAYGTKIKDGVEVPNCIPIKEEQSKQKFVIPTPESGEKESDYIGRCMSAISSEYDTQEQALAVCYAQLK